MKTTVSQNILLGLATLVIATPSLLAETILFHDTVQHGILYSDSETDAEVSIDNTTPYPEDGGTNSIVFSPLNGNAFRSGGLAFFGDNALTIPTDETVIKIACLAEENDQIVRFTVDTSDGSFAYEDTTPTVWRVDDLDEGEMTQITPGEWHTVWLDLTAIPGFNAGSTKLNGKVSVTNKSGVASVYLGDIRLVSPSEAAQE